MSNATNAQVDAANAMLSDALNSAAASVLPNGGAAGDLEAKIEAINAAVKAQAEARGMTVEAVKAELAEIARKASAEAGATGELSASGKTPEELAKQRAYSSRRSYAQYKLGLAEKNPAGGMSYPFGKELYSRFSAGYAIELPAEAEGMPAGTLVQHAERYGVSEDIGINASARIVGVASETGEKRSGPGSRAAGTARSSVSVKPGEVRTTRTTGATREQLDTIRDAVLTVVGTPEDAPDGENAVDSLSARVNAARLVLANEKAPASALRDTLRALVGSLTDDCDAIRENMTQLSLLANPERGRLEVNREEVLRLGKALREAEASLDELILEDASAEAIEEAEQAVRNARSDRAAAEARYRASRS